MQQGKKLEYGVKLAIRYQFHTILCSLCTVYLPAVCSLFVSTESTSR